VGSDPRPALNMRPSVWAPACGDTHTHSAIRGPIRRYSPLPTTTEPSLDDKYRLSDGHTFMTGIEALVRVPLALRHANLVGVAPSGGVLLLADDDPAAKSSTLPCASETALFDVGIPAIT